ncbi:SepM family pheromone-processing serine protease [Anaerobacillus alkalilacustris]|uniref:SepM family pheromone-processing serine protease n=1 Tax=Anaerobacillus alkalilacustris TaxID=393763 RepID=UPI000A033A2B|nr:SepM family pheromone-processing serine protease [Anaerobacillus alkalilacustris]
MSTINKPPFIKKRWIIILFFILFLNLYHLPYYFSKPGDANVLNTIIEVEGGYEDEGTFMLTTVRMGKANIVNYLWAQISDTRELIHEEFILRSGETDQEYHQRQILMMSSSQDIATIVAYQKAGKEAYFQNYGVLVTGMIEDMPAYALLELGDLIVAVNDTEVKTVDELLAQLGDQEQNNKVSLTIIRDEQKSVVELFVTSFPEEVDPTGKRLGIGITSPITKRELIISPNVTIDTKKIGGPSAGLMFSLEIYNQLVEEDLTKGYNIAGTGTINEEGEVGRIGGVKQKVIAAERVGADFFFAPNEFNSTTSNYQEALEASELINGKMEIVPIDSFEDAITFLENLDPK